MRTTTTYRRIIASIVLFVLTLLVVSWNGRFAKALDTKGLRAFSPPTSSTTDEVVSKSWFSSTEKEPAEYIFLIDEAEMRPIQSPDGEHEFENPKINEFMDLGDDEEYTDDEYFYAFFSSQQRQRKAQSSSQQTQRANIFQKLGESLGTSIVGCILIAFMPCLIWKNEGRHVNELSRIDFCKNNAVAVDCNTSLDENVGRLVHFTGNVTVGEESALDFGPADGINVTIPVPNAIVLKRTCYIYQKFELVTHSTKRDVVGGGETRTTHYNLKEDWTAMGPQPDCPNLNESNSRGVWDQILAITGGAEEAISYPVNEQPPPSAGMAAKMQQQQGPMPLEFAQALGLYNPQKPPQALAVSNETRVGEFFLSEKVITSNPSVFMSTFTPVPTDHIPQSVNGCGTLVKWSNNALCTFQEGALPQNGDCKIVFEFVPAGFDASFVVAQTASVPEDARQVGVKYGVDEAPVTGRCKNDLGQIWMVRRGTYNLYEMLDMAKSEAKQLTMIIRVIAWALLCAGWVMLFSPFITALQVLPLLSQLGYFAVVLTALITSCVCCLTVMIIAYMRYRPVITGGLLVVALGIWGILIWRWNTAAETLDDTVAPTPAPM